MSDRRIEAYVRGVLSRLSLDTATRRKVRDDMMANLAPLIEQNGVDAALRRYGTVEEVSQAFVDAGYQPRRAGRSAVFRVLGTIALALVLLVALVFVINFPARVKRGTPVAAEVTVSITELHMVTETEGWARSGSSLLRTVDGGLHWTSVLPPAITNYALTNYTTSAFAGKSSAWIAFGDGQPGWLSVWRTADAGTNWVGTSWLVASGKLIQPVSMQFVNDSLTGQQIVWLMAGPDHGMNSSPGQLFKSVDSGATWRAVSATDQKTGGLPFSGWLSFRDAKSGWLVGAAASTLPRKLFRTTDGGLTWAEQSLPKPSGLGAGKLSVDVPPVFFGDGQKGILEATYLLNDVPSNNYHAVTYRTTDGGDTWRNPVITQGPPAFVNATIAFAFVEGRIEKTTDGGVTWTSVKSNISAFIGAGEAYTLQFVSDQVGWLVVRPGQPAGSLLMTTDGGATWTCLETVLVQGEK